MAFCFAHRGLTPPTLLFYLLILPSHLHSILSSLSPLYHALVSAVFCQSVSICSEAQIISLLVVLADIVLFLFSSPVGLALLFLHPSFFILTPASLGLWSALCLGFSLFVCSSLHGNPPASSLLASSASPGSQRRLSIAFSLPLCPAG